MVNGCYHACLDSRRMKVASLSALNIGRLTPVTHFCLKLSLPQSHNAIGMINEMKKSRY